MPRLGGAESIPPQQDADALWRQVRWPVKSAPRIGVTDPKRAQLIRHTRRTTRINDQDARASC